MRYQIDVRSAGKSSWCGDFAEHIQLDLNRSAIVLGDVAGHGPSVGHAAFGLRAYAHWAVLNAKTLDQCLYAVDDCFSRRIMTNEIPFASLIVAIIDSRVGSLRYASAGHEPGLLFEGPGRHRHLAPTGQLLGLRAFATPDYSERRLSPMMNGLLVVVTDGITEARRRGTEGWVMFGTMGVVRAVRDAGKLRTDTGRAIHTAALEHGHGLQIDDASVAVATVSVAAPSTYVRRLRTGSLRQDRHAARFIANS